MTCYKNFIPISIKKYSAYSKINFKLVKIHFKNWPSYELKIKGLALQQMASKPWYWIPEIRLRSSWKKLSLKMTLTQNKTGQSFDLAYWCAFAWEKSLAKILR